MWYTTHHARDSRHDKLYSQLDPLIMAVMEAVITSTMNFSSHDACDNGVIFFVQQLSLMITTIMEAMIASLCNFLSIMPVMKRLISE